MTARNGGSKKKRWEGREAIPRRPTGTDGMIVGYGKYVPARDRRQSLRDVRWRSQTRNVQNNKGDSADQK